MAKDGYGHDHRKMRESLAKQLADEGSLTCWRCGELILPGDEWHLGHDDHDRSIRRGPEHARQCNLRAAGMKTAGKLNPLKASRNWWSSE